MANSSNDSAPLAGPQNGDSASNFPPAGSDVASPLKVRRPGGLGRGLSSLLGEVHGQSAVSVTAPPTQRDGFAMLAIAGLTAYCCTVQTQMHGCSIEACKPVELGLKFMESLPINL